MWTVSQQVATAQTQTLAPIRGTNEESATNDWLTFMTIREGFSGELLQSGHIYFFISRNVIWR